MQKGENVKFRLSEKYYRNKENTGKKVKVCQSFPLQQLYNCKILWAGRHLEDPRKALENVAKMKQIENKEEAHRRKGSEGQIPPDWMMVAIYPHEWETG